MQGSKGQDEGFGNIALHCKPHFRGSDITSPHFLPPHSLSYQIIWQRHPICCPSAQSTAAHFAAFHAVKVAVSGVLLKKQQNLHLGRTLGLNRIQAKFWSNVLLLRVKWSGFWAFWVLFLRWSKICIASCKTVGAVLTLEVLLKPSNWAMHQQSRVNLATCAKSVAPVNFMMAFQPLFCPFPGYSWTRFMAVSTGGDGGGWRKLGSS